MKITNYTQGFNKEAIFTVLRTDSKNVYSYITVTIKDLDLSKLDSKKLLCIKHLNNIEFLHLESTDDENKYIARDIKV